MPLLSILSGNMHVIFTSNAGQLFCHRFILNLYYTVIRTVISLYELSDLFTFSRMCKYTWFLSERSIIDADYRDLLYSPRFFVVENQLAVDNKYQIHFFVISCSNIVLIVYSLLTHFCCTVQLTHTCIFEQKVTEMSQHYKSKSSYSLLNAK